MSAMRLPSVPLAMIILGFGPSGTGAGILNSFCLGGDWPQILGPSRSGQAQDEKPITSGWKEASPQILWRQAAASGYAGAAIAHSMVYAVDRQEDTERLSALELTTGKRKWQATWATSYRSGINPDNGPRAVPCIAGTSAIVYGAGGELVCVDTTSGQIKWQRPVRKEFKAEDGYFGAGSSPIVIGNVVIVNIGGKQAGIIGVALDSGKDVWKATNFDASYSSPIEVDAGGVPAALVVTRLQTVLIRADNGQALGQTDFGARGPTVNAATPIGIGQDRYFLTASYGIGAKTLRIQGGKLQDDKLDKQLLASQYNTPVIVGNRIVGANGREDMGGVTLRTIDAETLKLVDEQKLPGPTHLIAVADQLLLLSSDGTLQLASMRSGKPQISDSFDVTDADSSGHVFRALPALADGVLVVRSSNSEGSGGQWIAVKLP